LNLGSLEYEAGVLPTQLTAVPHNTEEAFETYWKDVHNFEIHII
jgi:hypothetical protein